MLNSLQGEAAGHDMTTTAYPYISLNIEGVPYIEGTRIKVAHIVIDHVEGRRSAARIARAYPPLTVAQVHSALAYYHEHRDEIDRYIRERDETAERLRPQVENPALAAKLRAAKARAQRA
jgi:uncharacterized protein (DUF433 family)